MPQEVVAMTTVDGVLPVERMDMDKAPHTATPRIRHTVAVRRTLRV